LDVGSKVQLCVKGVIDGGMLIDGEVVAVDHERGLADIETPYCEQLGVRVVEKDPLVGRENLTCWEVD
jgi:hypothetical protein